jgi:hypothetical protein
MATSTYSQHDQVFVILRSDASTHERSPESAVALVKALWSQTAAETEVTRLNASAHEQGTVYFWKAARLERPAAVGTA